MAPDRALPTMTPEFVRIEMWLTDEAYWDLRVTQAQDRRYVSSADSTIYAGLCSEELQDVLAAIIDSLTL